jgi:cyclohexadieny/prephenate dehydrogenase
MRFHRVSILGVGLLGGSIGLAIRSKVSSCKVAGYGHRRATLERALEIGAIDEAYDTAAEAVRGADLVVLCTPVGLLGEILTQIAPALGGGAVVTDVGSTKRSVVEAGERVLPAGVHFVGSHPMAGSEKRGVEFARTDLFENATCIMTPTPRTDQAASAKVEGFWRLLGMRTTRLSPEQHDQLLAEVSHLPHAVAAALVAMQADAALPLAGKGFLDATRIAGGDGGLWRDILLDNADNVRTAVGRLRGELDRLLGMLDAGKGTELEVWLNAAASRREALLREKLTEMTPD